MSRTDKDTRESKMEHWMSVFKPSSWNRDQRQAERNKAKQSLRNRREPEPKYRRPYFW